MTAHPPGALRAHLRDAAALLGVLALLLGSGLAFVLPWLPPQPPSATLARYAPLHDGGAWLSVNAQPDGRPRSWTSAGVELIPATQALVTRLRRAQAEAVLAFYGSPEQPADLGVALERLGATGAQVFRIGERELGATGLITDSVAVGIRAPEGDYTLGLYRPDVEQDLIFEPALLELPGDLAATRSWETSGVFAGALDYVFSGRVVAQGPYRGKAGSFEDCVEIETRLTLSSGGQPVQDLISRSWRCAGVGIVASEQLAPDGALLTRTELVAATTLPEAAGDLPPAALWVGSASMPGEPVEDAAEWALTRHARLLPGSGVGAAAFAPVVVPSEPPLVLAGVIDGGLVALDARDPLGVVRWRFRGGGTFFGQPAYDPATGRIFAGAADKRLYALDARGLYLWSFEAEDNIATRPVIVDRVVVFGSEDRTVYGVDIDSGRLAWERPFAASGPVVSSPVVAGGLVLIGSDDGQVYGLDPASGEERWEEPFAAEDAIEAPIVVVDGVAYVASRDGQVYGLDPASGEEVWRGRAGGPLRSAPAVGAGRAFVVDELGYLKALDLESGRRLWVSPGANYTGPPALIGVEQGRPALVVARDDGLVELLDLDGRRQREWSARDLVSPAEDAPGLDFGPVAADGALWLVDDNGVVLRLGPPLEGPHSLEVAWYRSGAEPPFDGEGGSGLYYTPVEYGGRAVALDSAGNIYLVEPSDGAAQRIGRYGAAGLPTFAPEPVVARDTLLISSGGELGAVDLRDGGTLWTFAAEGEARALQPPAVAEGLALWAVGNISASGGEGTLYAIDLADGSVRWRAPLAGQFAAGGVIVRGDRVYTSAPPAAFDLATGRELWRAELQDTALGGGALNEAGDTLYVGWIGESSGGVAAIDTGDGSLRGLFKLGVTPYFADRLWLSGDTLIVPSDEGPIVALDAADGSERWRVTRGVRAGTITVAGGLIWQLNSDSHVVALRVSDGALARFYSAINANLEIRGSFTARPSPVGDRMIVALADALIAFEVE